MIYYKLSFVQFFLCREITPFLPPRFQLEFIHFVKDGMGPLEFVPVEFVVVAVAAVVVRVEWIVQIAFVRPRAAIGALESCSMCWKHFFSKHDQWNGLQYTIPTFGSNEESTKGLK
mmetsp:Transcript_15793/g.27502  ORF Transcript_15793/g.27502 Transcript_15793/m.27502 type:complete len:116 (+) Transcript_15793:99-446(+)